MQNFIEFGEIVFVRTDAMSAVLSFCNCEDDCGDWCGTAGD